MDDWFLASGTWDDAGIWVDSISWATGNPISGLLRLPPEQSQNSVKKVTGQ